MGSWTCPLTVRPANSGLTNRGAHGAALHFVSKGAALFFKALIRTMVTLGIVVTATVGSAVAASACSSLFPYH